MLLVCGMCVHPSASHTTHHLLPSHSHTLRPNITTHTHTHTHTAFAAGMMFVASIGLAYEGWQVTEGKDMRLALGLLAGVLFIVGGKAILEKHEDVKLMGLRGASTCMGWGGWISHRCHNRCPQMLPGCAVKAANDRTAPNLPPLCVTSSLHRVWLPPSFSHDATPLLTLSLSVSLSLSLSLFLSNQAPTLDRLSFSWQSCFSILLPKA